MRIKITNRKILAYILASLLLAGNMVLAENASLTKTEKKIPGKVYDNGKYEYEVLPDEKSIRLRQCVEDIKLKRRKVVIPQQIDGLPVKQLGNACVGGYRYAKSERSYIEEAVIPKGVEYIGKEAFLSLPNLNKVYIGDSVTKIDDAAFFLCKNLKNVEGGKNVKYIGIRAFASCKKLTKLPNFWSKSKEKIEHGYGCFRNTGLRSVTIPRWDAEVGDLFYAECKNLRKVVFTKGQKGINSETFSDCKNLKSVEFCPGLIAIGDSFRYCVKLEKADIPKTVKLIGRRAFQHCRSLKTVSLPNSLECLYDMAFQDCRSLKQIKIPKKIKKIEQKTFQGCKKLKKAVIPKSVKKIHKTAFSGCKKLVIHCQKGSYAHKYAKKYHIKHQFIK